jgi:hypothetical protein
MWFERMVKMKSTVGKTLVLALGVVFVGLPAAGCQEEQSRTNTMSNDQVSGPAEADRMSRLVAMENLELKGKLAEQEQRNSREMQKQKSLFDKEMRNKQRLLDSCVQQKKSLEELSRDGVESYMSNIVGPLSDENQKLRKENEVLKVEVQNLKGQLDRLRAEAGTPK